MNKFSSIFGQILQIFSRNEFYKAVRETGAEKGAKGFTRWQQFVGMLFCQLGQAHSLREICGGLASCMGKVKHPGIHASPNRSTLSYANEHRPWQLYQKIFYQLLEKCQGMGARKKFRFRNKLFSLDTDLDSIDSYPRPEVPEVQVDLWWSLSNLVAMLRYNLFAYRDLWAWINNPFEAPPFVLEMEQLSLHGI